METKEEITFSKAEMKILNDVIKGIYEEHWFYINSLFVYFFVYDN